MKDQENTSITNGSNPTDWYDHNGEPKSDDYSHLGNTYKSLSEDVKKNLAANIINMIKEIDGPDKELVISLQLCHWFRIDMSLGMAVANGLNINLQHLMNNMPRE